MTTTYRYLSLIRATMDNPEWDDEEGDVSAIAGKVPETYMPNVVDEENDRIVGRRYEREALVELPEWMTAEDAFEWARETVPEGFEEIYGEEQEAVA